MQKGIFDTVLSVIAQIGEQVAPGRPRAPGCASRAGGSSVAGSVPDSVRIPWGLWALASRLRIRVAMAAVLVEERYAGSPARFLGAQRLRLRRIERMLARYARADWPESVKVVSRLEEVRVALSEWADSVGLSEPVTD